VRGEARYVVASHKRAGRGETVMHRASSKWTLLPALAGAALSLGAVRAADGPPAGWPAYLKNFTLPAGRTWDQYRVRAKDGMPQALIPAGEFLMGANPAQIDHELDLLREAAEDDVKQEEASDAGPQKRVYLDLYWIDLHDVTNAQYARFLNSRQPDAKTRKTWLTLAGETSDEYLEPQILRHDGRYGVEAGKENYPMMWVSWRGAAAYAQWAATGLPTEAQWEKAARGGREGLAYVWGDSDDPPAGAGNFADETAAAQFSDWKRPGRYYRGYYDDYATTSPVGAFHANGYGLYDMAGNVWQWCADWFQEGFYATMPARNPRNTTPSDGRSQRGGAWSADPAGLPVASRMAAEPERQNPTIGFRCIGQ
jgi:formylglycine-generating enzyme required for sulfatase activity